MIKKYSIYIALFLIGTVLGAGAGYFGRGNVELVTAEPVVCPPCDPIMIQSIDWNQVKKARIRDFTYAPTFSGRITVLTDSTYAK